MTRRGTRLLSIIIALGLLAGLPAFATMQHQDDWLEWITAVNFQYAYHGFDNLVAKTYNSGTYPSGLLLTPTVGASMGDFSLVSWVGANRDANFAMEVYDENAATWKNWGGNGKIVRNSDYVTSAETGFRVTFSAGAIYAVYLDVMVGNLGGPTGSAAIAPGGTVFDTMTTQPRPTRTSIGILSDSPFTYLDVINVTPVEGSYAILDNLYYTTYQPTLGGGSQPGPEAAEPMTLLFIGSGLVFLSALRRFKSQNC